jgi:zinc and cadmium transporter
VRGAPYPGARARAPIVGTVLAEIGRFVGLETLVLWRDGHDRAGDVSQAAGPFILLGDALHNIADGEA